MTLPAHSMKLHFACLQSGSWIKSYNNADLADMHLASCIADCNGRSTQRLYGQRYLQRETFFLIFCYIKDNKRGFTSYPFPFNTTPGKRFQLCDFPSTRCTLSVLKVCNNCPNTSYINEKGNGFLRNLGVPQVNGLYGGRSCILAQLVVQSEL
ncbi:hypothetical protein TNCV_4818321 [Trichonephila clavipes]|nr:hypothetical protein TNCV_4818321 [Trichonephila clavipes]